MKSNKKLQLLQAILVCLILIYPITKVLAVVENDTQPLVISEERTAETSESTQEALVEEEAFEAVEEISEPLADLLLPESTLDLPEVAEKVPEIGQEEANFEEAGDYLSQRSFEGRNFNPQFSNGQINLGGDPNLGNTRDWWTHLYHYNTRLFFLTYVKEKLPPIGYEIGDESRLVIPRYLQMSDSDYYNRHMLRRISGYNASEIPARSVVPNPQQGVWTSSPGSYTSAVASAGFRERYMNFLTAEPATFFTEDRVFSLTLQRTSNAIDYDIEIIIRRLRAEPSSVIHFRNLRVGYFAHFVALDWSSGSGWNRVRHREDPITGSFSPDIDFPRVSPELAISKIKDGVLEVHDSFSEDPFDYVRIDKKMNQGRQTARFITHPNVDQLGRQTVTVEVADIYGGFRNIQRIDVEFDVQNTLTGEGNPQVLNVGADISSLDSKSLLRNVRRNGSLLNSQDYEAQLLGSPTLNHVGEEEWQVRLTYQGESHTAVIIPVKVTVEWGNSLRILTNHERTVMAVTLNRNAQNNLILNGVQGAPRLVGNLIHGSFPEKYFHVGVYRLNQSEDTYENLTQLNYFEKSGHDSIQTAYQSWIPQEVAVGDLVGIYHREVLNINQRLLLYTNNIESIPYANRQHRQAVSYYEVTEEGFKPRYFNQLTPRRHSAEIFTEESLLDQEITHFFAPNSALNQSSYQFLNYPPTNVSGIQGGNIAVSEMLDVGKRIIYPYEVELLVGQGSLVATVPANMEFFDYQITNNPQTIQRRESNWSIKVNDRRGDNQQPVWRIISRVERNNDGLSDYYVYRQGNTVTPLDQGVEVYRSGNESRSGPIMTDINWSRNQGVQLMVPSTPPLQGNRNYQDRIEWSLIQGP